MADLMLVPFAGTVQSIRPVNEDCCSVIVGIRSGVEFAEFTITTDTYVIQETMFRIGMHVTAFYDASAPVPLIFPPRYRAVIIGRRSSNETIAAERFDHTLTNQDRTLTLNIARGTEIVSSTGQRYTCPIENQFLIVYYSITTRSIPAQTTPRKIIVLCRNL